MSPDPNRYKSTILLPATDFPMRGDLPRREPEAFARWEREGLYQRIEAIFKAFSRAIRMAITKDADSDRVPSSKGVI